MGLFGGLKRLISPEQNSTAQKDDSDWLSTLMQARALSAGDYGSAAQMMYRDRSLAAEQRADQARIDAAANARSGAVAALKARGYTDADIAGMTTNDISSLLRDALAPRQFGASGGSIYTPGMGGAQGSFLQAPSRHEYQGSVFDIGSDGGVTPRFEGRQIVPLQPGGEAAVFNSFTGQEVGAGGAQAPAGPPPAAIDALKSNPSLADQFDAKYGRGASSRYLGGAGLGQRGFP